MKKPRILVTSAREALRYVWRHLEYPMKLDTYAAISIQDTIGGGFEFQLTENRFCKGVLTLYFDDIIREVDGAVLFSEEQAERIIDFIGKNRKTETLLVHCYGGESRSRAVAAFAVKMLGHDNSKYFKTGHPNQHVYNVLEAAWVRRMVSGSCKP